MITSHDETDKQLIACDVQEGHTTAVRITLVFIHLALMLLDLIRSASHQHQVTIRSRQANHPESPAPAVVSVLYNGPGLLPVDAPRNASAPTRRTIPSATPQKVET